jgi:hypothetical protein
MLPNIEGGASREASRYRAYFVAALSLAAPLAFADAGCAVGEETDPRGSHREVPDASLADASAGKGGSAPRGSGGSGGTTQKPDSGAPESGAGGIESEGGAAGASLGGGGNGGANSDGGTKASGGNGGQKPVGGAGGVNAGGSAGSSGGGGSGGTLDCTTDPKAGSVLAPTSKWKVSVSSTGFNLLNDCSPTWAIDGDEATRWCSDGAQKGGEWFKLDVGEQVCISEILLLSDGTDAPIDYELLLSTDGKATKSVAKGKGSSELRISFPRQQARHLEFRQHGTSPDGNWWSIYDLVIRR